MARRVTQSDIFERLPLLPRWPLPVVEAREEGTRYRRIVVDASEHPISAGYRHPGQFVAMKTPAEREPRYFVLASSPGDLPRVEFLVTRTDADLAGGMVHVDAGDLIEASAAQGDGYALDRDPPDSLVIMVTGAGIASVRPLLRDWLDGHPHLADRVHLFYGETSPCAHAFSQELDEWAARGMRVHRVCDGGPEQTHAPRFVQEAWRDEGASAMPSGAHYVLCGAEPMQYAAAELLAERGVGAERIHYNW